MTITNVTGKSILLGENTPQFIIPSDVFNIILRYLPLEDLFSLGVCSKLLAHVTILGTNINKNDFLIKVAKKFGISWKMLLNKDLKNEEIARMLGAREEDPESFEKLAGMIGALRKGLVSIPNLSKLEEKVFGIKNLFIDKILFPLDEEKRTELQVIKVPNSFENMDVITELCILAEVTLDDEGLSDIAQSLFDLQEYQRAYAVVDKIQDGERMLDVLTLFDSTLAEKIHGLMKDGRLGKVRILFSRKENQYAQSRIFYFRVFKRFILEDDLLNAEIAACYIRSEFQQSSALEMLASRFLSNDLFDDAQRIAYLIPNQQIQSVVLKTICSRILEVGADLREEVDEMMTRMGEGDYREISRKTAYDDMSTDSEDGCTLL